jgi:hypothetical protein
LDVGTEVIRINLLEDGSVDRRHGEEETITALYLQQ